MMPSVKPTANPQRGGRWYLAAAVISVFLSAALLFLVEPMAARILLPHYGGSPAVWNTAMVFYQLVLLAGYAYAHWLTGHRRPGLRPWLHLAVVLAPLALLPPWPEAVAPTKHVGPTMAVLLSLGTAVGLPFFALSSNASLVQTWLVARRPEIANPYRLYAASNAGSFLALLAYPSLVEPRLGLRDQATAWSLGYAAFAILVTATMRWPTAAARGGPPLGADPVDDWGSPPIRAGRRGMWLLRAAVPSSLLLGATLTITTDALSMPLWWVLPLALYLLGYVVAFAWPDRLPRRPLAALAALCVALSLAVTSLQILLPVVLLVVLALTTVLASSALCHLDLARDRPPSDRLTEFYLWIALGGAVGGVFNSLVAPVVFDSVAEWPIGLTLLAWLAFRPGAAVGAASLRRPWGLGLLLPAATVLGVGALAMAGLATGSLEGRGWWLLMLVLLLPYGLALPRRHLLFPLAACLLTAVAVLGWNAPAPVVEQARSFFGVLRVRETAERRVLLHGTTVHGSQSLKPELRSVPGSYYHPAGPLGSVMRAQRSGARIALVGLGTGALAALGKPGQEIDIFEIDPLVERFARKWFTYLSDSPAHVQVEIADGRLGLARRAPAHYDLVVADAFSSDSVPAHLLTREAMALTLDRTRPGGCAVFHISNRSLDLSRIFRAWSQATGRPVAIARWEPPAAARAQGAAATVAVALAPDAATIERLLDEPSGLWQPLPVTGPASLWSDDHSDLLSVLRSPW